MQTGGLCSGFWIAWLQGSPFIDTKLNSITLEDYTVADGLRGPSYLYGWIQGRGLEALATHAAFFERTDPTLASPPRRRGQRALCRAR